MHFRAGLRGRSPSVRPFTHPLYTPPLLRYTGGMIYDVSLPVSPELVRWPGDPAVEVARFGSEVQVSRWTLGSHAGTHVDAPRHFSAGPGTVDTLDPSVLIGPCRVLYLPEVPLITADLLRAHTLAGVTRLLLRTRNSERWRTDTTTFHEDFTALLPDAAELLVEIGIRLIGIDALSIEPYDGDGRVHHTLLRAEVIPLEGLYLAEVPPGDYHLLCAPLKLMAADGAPARVFLQEMT